MCVCGGGDEGEGVPSLLRHVLIFVFVTSIQSVLSMTLRSSEILSHGQLTVFKFKGFLLIETNPGNGVSLSVSRPSMTVSVEMQRL